MFVEVLLLFLAKGIVCPPVEKSSSTPAPGQAGNETQDWNLGLEYNKYLQEVVQILESDPEFRQKLESADVDHIRDGTIAKELDSLNHHVRSKLDEVKRMELERLRHLAQKQYEESQGIDRKHLKIPKHLDLKSAKFDVEDLKKLIKQTTDDLEEADKQRREDFKKYEMEKKFEKDMRLKAINDTDERKVVQEEMEKMEAEHRSHDKLKHPMTKDQLEEVWEEQDHMAPQDWDAKTFFAMHDLDGNGKWDENEVRILFRKELDKAYDPSKPEDDMREREEEMERMREHVFKESDSDKDRMISFDEFLAETQRDEFEKDPGWDTLDEDDSELYTDEEFERFESQREAEMQAMLAQQAQAGQYPHPGYQAGQQGLPQGYNFQNIPAMPPVGYGHPGGMPHPGAMPVYQGQGVPQGMAPQFAGAQHPQYAQPGPPLPGVDRNGVPMHGSLPGQPAHPNFVPGGQPQLQQQQFAGQQQQQPPQFGAPQAQAHPGGIPQPQQPVGQPQFQQQQQPIRQQPPPAGQQQPIVQQQPAAGQQQPIVHQPVGQQQPGVGQPQGQPAAIPNQKP